MTENLALPPLEQPIAGSEVPPDTSPPNRVRLLPWICGLGFLLLAAAIFYVWQHPSVPDQTAANAGEIRANAQKLEANEQKLGANEQKLEANEQKLGVIDARLGHLEQQPSPPTAAELAKLATRLDTLEPRVSDQTQMASRLDVLSGRIESLSGRGQSGLDAIKQQLDHDAARVGGLEKTTASLQGLSNRVDHLVRLQAAEVALAAGRPLGDLPDAPPALARFAHDAPPTLPQLRLAFRQVEGTALSASQATTANGPFIDRVWERAQGLVTVRQGDQVVVGNTAAVALAQVRSALDAGDLDAAVKATENLPADTLHAVADWLAQATALLDARSALADMAAHT